MISRHRLPRIGELLAVLLIVAVACSSGGGQAGPASAAPTTVTPGPVRKGSLGSIIPKPVSVRPAAGEFALSPDTRIDVADGAGAAHDAVALLCHEVERSTGYHLLSGDRDTPPPDAPKIEFTTSGADRSFGDEGYEVHITRNRVQVVARGHEGFIWGVQTIMQVLPPRIDATTRQLGSWKMPAGTIRDHPRYPWRGYLLDVARQFVPVPEVERLVDLMSRYKMNRLHLHLTDDQGWRIQIPTHPELTEAGATPRIGGGGGYYTVKQYRQIVAFAQAHGVVVVPEVDMPGHVTAALIADPSLACDGKAPAPHPGVGVSTNALCTTKDSTMRFVKDVIDELVAITPGPYIHIGGDEATGLDPADYASFITRVANLVVAHHKTPIGWDEIANLPNSIGAIVQVWHYKNFAASVALQDAPGTIVSPADRAYLDQAYNASIPYGFSWTGFVDTQKAYSWDPATVVPGLPAAKVVGVEAAMWSDSRPTFVQVQKLTLPRLPGYAELGWSPEAGRSWDTYKVRLATQAPRWEEQGFAYYPDAVVPWADHRSGGG